MGFDSYETLKELLDNKLSLLEMNMNTGVTAINNFITYLQNISEPTDSSTLDNILNNMKASDFGMGSDLIDKINYYKGESRDLIINKIKKFVDTDNEKGIYYQALSSLDPSINEYNAVVQLQNLKTITNNLGNIADGKLSFKSQIENAEKIMGFMADTMGKTNVSNLNNAQNRLKGIIHGMKMLTDEDYNVDIPYLIDKYSPNDEIATNMKNIHNKIDEIAKEAMDNYNSVLSSGESIVSKKYW